MRVIALESTFASGFGALDRTVFPREFFPAAAPGGLGVGAFDAARSASATACEIVSETASLDMGVAGSAKGRGAIVCQRLERTETRLTALQGLHKDIGTAIGETRRAAALAHSLDNHSGHWSSGVVGHHKGLVAPALWQRGAVLAPGGYPRK